MALCIAGCSASQDLGSPPRPAAVAGDSGGASSSPQPVDAGPPIFYATYNDDVKPSGFTLESSTSYREGYTVLVGSGLMDTPPDYVLPTVIQATIKFPSAVGTYTCGATTVAAVQLDLDYDSNANLRKSGTTVGIDYDTCSIDITSFDPAGGRIVGTFSAQLSVGKLTHGVIDVPRSADE